MAYSKCRCCHLKAARRGQFEILGNAARLAREIAHRHGLSDDDLCEMMTDQCASFVVNARMTDRAPAPEMLVEMFADVVRGIDGAELVRPPLSS